MEYDAIDRVSIVLKCVFEYWPTWVLVSLIAVLHIWAEWESYRERKRQKDKQERLDARVDIFFRL